MAERMTDIGPRSVPDEWKGAGIGIAHHGRETRADMIAAYRAHYQRQLAKAQYALGLTDDELIVETYTGVWARNNRKEVTD